MTKRRVHAAAFLLVGIGLIFTPLPPSVKDLLYRTYNLVLFVYIVWAVAGPRVREAVARHAGVRVRISEPLGLHPRLVDVVLERVEDAT